MCIHSNYKLLVGACLCTIKCKLFEFMNVWVLFFKQVLNKSNVLNSVTPFILQ